MDTLPTDLLKIISQYKTEIDHSTKLKKSLKKIKAINYKIETRTFKWIREQLLYEENHGDIDELHRLKDTSYRKLNGNYREVQYYWYGHLTMVKLNQQCEAEIYELEDESGDNTKYTNVPLTD